MSQNVFQQFLEFSRREHREGRLSGDLFSSLPEDWECWLALLTWEEKTEFEQQMHALAAGPLERQMAELSSACGQNGFSSEEIAVVLYRLAQVPALGGWACMEQYRRKGGNDLWIQAAFVADYRPPGSQGIIRSIKAAIIQYPSQARTHGAPKVWTSGFSADPFCKAAMEQAATAVSSLLGLRGLLVLMAYVAAGNFLPVSIWRTWQWWRQAGAHRRLLASCVIEISMDGLLPFPVAGGSIALPVLVAVLLALYRDSLEFMRDRLKRSAFSGGIADLNITLVAGIREKVLAMEQHGCKMGFLPAANAGDAVSESLSLHWCATVPAVLIRLVGARKYVVTNAIFLFLVAVCPMAVPYVVAIQYPPPVLSGFEDSYGFTDAETAAAYGFKIRQTDRVTIRLEGDADDGRTQIKAVTFPDSHGRRSDDLKTIDTIEEWHAEITVAVHQQSASFDYSQGREGEGALIEICVVRNQKLIRAVPLVLDVTPQ
jgi:hypothetical protein